MNVRTWACAALASVGISAATQALELPLPPMPPKSADKIFERAPKPWHDYLVKVRAAEQITDPLQRCLAFRIFQTITGPKAMPQHTVVFMRSEMCPP